MENIMYVMVEDQDLQTCIQKLGEETMKNCGQQSFRLVNSIITQVMKKQAGVIVAGQPPVVATFIALNILQRDSAEILFKGFSDMLPALRNILEEKFGSNDVGQSQGDSMIDSCVHDWDYLGEIASNPGSIVSLHAFKCLKCSWTIKINSYMNVDDLPKKGRPK